MWQCLKSNLVLILWFLTLCIYLNTMYIVDLSKGNLSYWDVTKWGTYGHGNRCSASNQQIISSQNCIKRSLLRQRKGGLLRQMISVVSLRFWIEGILSRIGGKWSEQHFRWGVRGPPRPQEADDKMMQNPGIWAFPGS